jgi:hypothetical protein
MVTYTGFFPQINSGYLNHLIDVLDRVGYTYTTHDDGDWELLWSHNYPFTELATQLQKLKPYQKVGGTRYRYSISFWQLYISTTSTFLLKVNHFPGSGFITNKASLVTIDIPAIPIAFQIPNDKQAFLKEVHHFNSLNTNIAEILGIREEPICWNFRPGHTQKSYGWWRVMVIVVLL